MCPVNLSPASKAEGIQGHLYKLNGVTDGTWTRDILDHNQTLYQLSYSHSANDRTRTYIVPLTFRVYIRIDHLLNEPVSHYALCRKHPASYGSQIQVIRWTSTSYKVLQNFTASPNMRRFLSGIFLVLKVCCAGMTLVRIPAVNQFISNAATPRSDHLTHLYVFGYFPRYRPTITLWTVWHFCQCPQRDSNPRPLRP